MNGNGWLQGQSHLTLSIKTLTAWEHHITSTQNYRTIYGNDTCSNYETRVSTEIQKALHVGVKRHDIHIHLFHHLHALFTCTQKNMTICPPLSQTQHFTKHQTGLTDFVHPIAVQVVSWKLIFSDMLIHSRSKQTSTLVWRFFRLSGCL
jgi:hypothetical protein